MSKIKNNPIMKSASGMLGDTVVYRKIRGILQMANTPGKREKGPTPKQSAVQRKFRDAAQYAKRQFAIPEAKTLYSTGITESKHSAYLVAMNDYLNSPTVDSVDAVSYLGAVGDAIIVVAVDDFMVTKVKILITSAAGVVLEQGEATPDALRSNQWEYKATVANATLAGTTIKAIAYDRPGNTGIKEVVL